MIVVASACVVVVFCARPTVAAPILDSGGAVLDGRSAGLEAAEGSAVPLSLRSSPATDRSRSPADFLRRHADPTTVSGESLETVLRSMLTVRARPATSSASPRGRGPEPRRAADEWEDGEVAIVYRALLNSEVLGAVARAVVEPELLENGVKTFSVLGFGRFSIELGSPDVKAEPAKQGDVTADQPGVGALAGTDGPSNGRQHPGEDVRNAAEHKTPIFVRFLRGLREFLTSTEGAVCLFLIGWAGLVIAAVRAGLRVQRRRQLGRLARTARSGGQRRQAATRRVGGKMTARFDPGRATGGSGLRSTDSIPARATERFPAEERISPLWSCPPKPAELEPTTVSTQGRVRG